MFVVIKHSNNLYEKYINYKQNEDKIKIDPDYVVLFLTKNIIIHVLQPIFTCLNIYNLSWVLFCNINYFIKNKVYHTNIMIVIIVVSKIIISYVSPTHYTHTHKNNLVNFILKTNNIILNLIINLTLITNTNKYNSYANNHK